MQLPYFLLVASIAVYPVAVSGNGLPERAIEVEIYNRIEERNSVQECKGLLIALKASAFCSSFVPILPKTATATRTGPLHLTTTTVTPPPVTVTSTSTYSSNGPVEKRSPKGSTCSIKGFPILQPFACEIIREACLLFVTPGVTTRTTTIPGSTSTARTTLPTSTTTLVTTTTATPAGPTCNDGTLTDPPNAPGSSANCNCDYQISCNILIVAGSSFSSSVQSSYATCASQCDTYTNCFYFQFNQLSGNCLLYSTAISVSGAANIVLGKRLVNTCQPNPSNFQCPTT